MNEEGAGLLTKMDVEEVKKTSRVRLDCDGADC